MLTSLETNGCDNVATSAYCDGDDAVVEDDGGQ